MTLHPVTGERTVLRNYTVGTTRAASVGDPIIEVRNGARTPAYEVAFDYQPPDAGLSNSQKPMTKGMRFTACERIEGDSSILVCNTDYINGVAITPGGYVTRGWVGTSANLRGLKMVQGSWTTDQLFTPIDGGDISKGSFMAQLIFSGITGNTLRAVYREYSNDMARPAFTTELQYNLDESKVIAYKSIKIEVLKATNNSLEYKVLSDDNLPWLP
jgi:hypothetical protein